MTTKEAKDKLFEAVQLLMEIYKELSERTAPPDLHLIEGKKSPSSLLFLLHRHYPTRGRRRTKKKALYILPTRRYYKCLKFLRN